MTKGVKQLPPTTDITIVRKCSDPSRFDKPHDLGPDAKIVLGLDMGTNCGYSYAIIRKDGSWEFNPWFMGLWDLSTGRYDSGNLGFLRLRRFLTEVSPCAIFYEDVKFTPGEAITKYNASRVLARAATSSELLGAFRQIIMMWAEDHGAICAGVPIGTIKRKATGRGVASKEDVIKACNAKFSTNFDIETYTTTGADNVADSAFVLVCGLEEYGNVLFNGAN